MTRPRAARRGSYALEVGLSLPLFLILIIGVLEWGWAMPREVTLEHVARDAARAGALTEDSSGPEAVALARADVRLLEAGFDPTTITVTAATGTTAVGNVIVVTVSEPYSALLGLVPTPAVLRGEATMRLEDQ